MVTLTSSSSTPKTSFDFMKNSNSHTVNIPFTSSSSSSSSYLSIKEDVVVTTKKLMEPSKTLRISINPKEEELADEKKIVKKASEDPEIGVFGAEKYFNGDMDSDKSSSILSLSLTNPELERTVVDSKQSAKKSTGTPSVRSESSWNSQSVLLQNKLVNSCNSSLQEKKNNSGQIQKVSNNKKSFLANLGCRCACSDGNSVEVDEKISVKRSSDPNISVFTARKIENQMSSSENMNIELIKIQKQEQFSQRKSSEVFGSPVNIEKKRIVVQKKKVTLRPWESRKDEEDTKSEASDTSADLFEIESFKQKPKLLLTRQGSDLASPTCYAPSEVSVEWSIVTASAADFSVMSECATSPIRKNRSSQIPRIPNTAKSAPQRRKSSSSVGSDLLLGCKSYKSVRVSGDSDRKSSMNKTQPSYVPRFPMETTKPKSFETRRRISNSSPFHTQSSILYSQ